ncbi:MAG: hypothetical protein ACP5R5_01590 [Armatimonadota bacterium]
MEIQELQQEIAALKDKLNRARRQLAALREKGRLLSMQYEDARAREQRTNEIIAELLERQRELNVMLNRANIMLNRTQEAIALTSIEFNEMAKALPEPKKAEWAERVARINELFKKTGIQDAELIDLEGPEGGTASDLASDELLKESQRVFGERESIWDRIRRGEPPAVEASRVDEHDPEPGIETARAEPEVVTLSPDSPPDEGEDERQDETDEGSLMFPPRRKSWWRRAAG